MPFFSPWMLLGLIAAAAPVILHILRRRTAERVLWGAWMFLVESMRQKRRKLMIEDIILLVLRTTMLVFAALAFARPFLPEMHLFGSRGMDKDVAIVLDVSASMRLKDATGRTAFDRAVEEARELVKLSPKGTSFGLVLGDRVPVILTPAPFSTKQEILDLLEKLEPGSDTMDAPRSLAAAGEVLAGGNNPAKEVIVYGDGQGYGWKAGDEAEWKRVERIFSRFDRRPPVVWRTLDRPGTVRNATIAAVTPSRRIIGTDRPLTFSVTVLNSGSEALSPGDVTMTLDGAELARLPVGQILPGLSRTFEVPCAFATNGHHVVVTSLPGGDDIACDDTVTNSVDVLQSLEVVLVNGRPSETGYARPTAFLEAALRPELKGTNDVFLVRPRTVRAATLEDPASFRGANVTVLCDVPFLSPTAYTNLCNYVSGGGGLLVVPGERSQLGFYTNRVFAAAWTNWNGAVKDVTFEGAPVVGRVEFDENAFSNGLEVVSRFSDGAAAFVTGTYGRGRTAVSAVPFDMAYTTLPARPGFVPLAHELVYALSSTNSFTGEVDPRWRAKEGDLTPLPADDADRLRVNVELATARSADDALAAIVGKSFGVEIWRPFAILALLLLAAEILFCRRLDRERGGEVRSRLSRALRALALLALAWMLAHIVWVHDVSRPIHRRVAVFTDRSLSMRRHDAAPDGATNALSRLDIATNVAERLERRLGRKYDVEPFAFGAESTDFAAALELALERIPSEELAGALFVTDGRQSVDTQVEAAARRFARLGAKVSGVVVGSVSNRADAAISSVVSSETVFLGDKVRIGASLRADRMKGGKLAVRLMEGDRQVDRREFDVDSDAWTGEVRFVDDPSERGVRRYRIELETPEGDTEKANDSWPVDVAVSDDRTNVLLVDRRPRWEYRYLRNLFYGRDKSVHLQYVVTQPDRLTGAVAPNAPAADATRQFGDAEAGQLPQSRDAWRKFDVIILGDLSPDDLGEAAQRDIAYCVKERGAMLVTIAGGKYMPMAYDRAPLAELLPVAMTNEAGEVTSAWEDCPTKMMLTPGGRGHIAMALAANASENERIWSLLPPWRGRVSGLAPKTGAEVLGFAGDATAATAPLVTVRGFGRGKTLFLASDETWRLRYRKGDIYHHRFWGNVLRWGAGEKLRDGNLFARVGTDSLHYLPGETVKLRLRLSNLESLPIEDAKPTAKVTLPDGKERTVDLRRRDGANGYYEVDFDETAQSGSYRVSVVCKEGEKRLGKEWPADFGTSFSVDTGFAPVEYAQMTADFAVPKEMARLTGGEVVAAEDEEKLELAFGAGRSEVTDHVESHLWDHPIAFVLFALALILEWLWRKRRGLA